MSRFLIIQTAFIGDVVLALPVAQYLRVHHPTATIHFVVRSGNESLLENHPAIDHIHTWNKRQGKYANLWRLARTLRHYRFDEVINLQRFAASGWLTLLMKSRVKKGFAKNPLHRLFTHSFPHDIPNLAAAATAEQYLHEVQRNLQLVAGDAPAIIRPQLYPSEADYHVVDEMVDGRRYFIVAPASVWHTKQWPVKQWERLLAHLPQQIAVFIIGSKADIAIGNQLLDAHPQAENWCGKLTMLQSAALMKNALRVFVNDSGPLHFASGVNAPVTALFCSTMPAFGFGPLSDESRVVETTKPLSCRPCGLHGKRACPLKHFDCAQTISTTQVFTPAEWATVVAGYPSQAAINYEIAQRLWKGASLQWQQSDSTWWLANPLVADSWQQLSTDQPALLLYTDQRMLNQYAHSLPDRYFDLLDLMHQQPLAVHLPFLKNLPEAAETKKDTYWMPAPSGLLTSLITLLDRPLLAVPVPLSADLQWPSDNNALLDPQRVVWTGQHYQPINVDPNWSRLQQLLNK